MKLLTKVRKVINPPYTFKDIFTVIALFIILLSIPLVTLNLEFAQEQKTTAAAAGGDSDGDGFSDKAEKYMGTKVYIACGSNAWPPDFDNNQFVNVSDLNYLLPPVFGSKVGDPLYSRRLDLIPNGKIDQSDVDLVADTFWGDTCAVSPPPQVNIKANGSGGPITVSYKTGVTIKWTSTNALSCSVSPTGWVGKSGSKSTGPLTASKTYTLTCLGPGGKRSDSVLVNVSPPPPLPTPPPPPPPPPTPTEQPKLKLLTLQISVPYLMGGLKVPIYFKGFNKELAISPGKNVKKLEIKKTQYRVGDKFTIRVGGNKTLVKKITLKIKSSQQSVNVGNLVLGDMNMDNVISAKDATALIKSIADQTADSDLNADGSTNSLDWAIFLANVGKRGN
jgi:hypothetical protein